MVAGEPPVGTLGKTGPNGIAVCLHYDGGHPTPAIRTDFSMRELTGKC